MTDPVLVPPHALQGVSVGISVSESPDLLRLGLTPEHCDFAVAEIARAVLLAGGTIVYGGRLRPPGFTRILMEEVRRYSETDDALTICVPASEHRHLTAQELDDVRGYLDSAALLVLLDRDGEPVERARWADRPPVDEMDVPAALTAMRSHITGRTDARVVVGGKLAGFTGRAPGIVEEAMMSVEAGQPLYVAGGFGGAAAAVARVLDRDDQQWAPPDLPEGAEDDRVRTALAQLARAAADRPPPDDGLSDLERRQLAASHRPGDIATFLVLGLARARARRKSR